PCSLLGQQLEAWISGELVRLFNQGQEVAVHPRKRTYGVTNGAIVIHTQRLKSDPGGNLLS
ncbi:hypothetical protein QS605_25345, partial [Escherichia coli]|nr:hypothetical protein [Escherichia coli]